MIGEILPHFVSTFSFSRVKTFYFVEKIPLKNDPSFGVIFA
jgi:hypothetical protein